MMISSKAMRSQFLLGIPEIDDEHTQLFDCLDALAFSVGKNHSDVQAFQSLDKLTAYSQTHFRVEECLMRVFDYPELEEHKQQHDHFIAKLADLHRRILTEDVTVEMVSFLTNWLLGHIKHVDTEYLAFFKARNSAEICLDTKAPLAFSAH